MQNTGRRAAPGPLECHNQILFLTNPYCFPLKILIRHSQYGWPGTQSFLNSTPWLPLRPTWPSPTCRRNVNLSRPSLSRTHLGSGHSRLSRLAILTGSEYQSGQRTQPLSPSHNPHSVGITGHRLERTKFKLAGQVMPPKRLRSKRDSVFPEICCLGRWMRLNWIENRARIGGKFNRRPRSRRIPIALEPIRIF